MKQQSPFYGRDNSYIIKHHTACIFFFLTVLILYVNVVLRVTATGSQYILQLQIMDPFEIFKILSSPNWSEITMIKFILIYINLYKILAFKSSHTL